MTTAAMARPSSSPPVPNPGYGSSCVRLTAGSARPCSVGYKIGLELIVKCGCERVVEVPIHFEDRRFGESKLTFKQQLLYLKHLRRLYIFKYGVWTQLMQFLFVGLLGTVVNLAVLTVLL